MYNLINTPGSSHDFCPWCSLVELGKNSLWTWLPIIFLKFGVSLIVILTHLKIRKGSLDNRFKKPLALSFQNTPWKTDLKINFLKNFHLSWNQVRQSAFATSIDFRFTLIAHLSLLTYTKNFSREKSLVYVSNAFFIV